MIGYTKVWRVNRQLVVADSIEEAIRVYQDNYEYPYNDVKEISLVDGHCSNANALIRKEAEK